MDNLTNKIRDWAEKRNLHNASPDKQMLKLMEEVGELAESLAKSKPKQAVDSIGDVYVVLTILAMQLGLNVEECVAWSYNEIRDRKGEMINGVYVKDQDL